ncbi:hypothetical protein T06_2779, partial [Trichinella sp. T6]
MERDILKQLSRPRTEVATRLGRRAPSVPPIQDRAAG